MRKAIVETATGLVVNVIEIEHDGDGGFSHWRCPDGCEIFDDGGGVGPGWTRDGQNFIRPELVESRIDVLLHSPTFITQTDGMEVPRDKATLADEREELLRLLHERLQADPGLLTVEETRKMLQLERWA